MVIISSTRKLVTGGQEDMLLIFSYTISWSVGKKQDYLSTWCRKVSAASLSSVMMHSVWALQQMGRVEKRVRESVIKTETKEDEIQVIPACLPCWCMWSMAAFTSSTISIVQAIELYSWCNDVASAIFKKVLALGPPCRVTSTTDELALVNRGPPAISFGGS